MRSNRYLRLAQRHFMIAFTAGSFALAFVSWAFAAGLYGESGWCIASVMAAVFALFICAVEGREAHRCYEISHKFDRWERRF